MTISAQDAWKYKFTVKEGFVGPRGGAPLDAVFNVKKGDHLIFRFDPNASGAWTDGDSVSGPEGSTKPWPDNFLNRTDLGKVGPYEARTACKYWDALVGYIGSSPPARGSYTSPETGGRDVKLEAERVFPIFPQLGETTSVWRVQQEGLLWLAFNADAYSNYTVDNSGEVKVFVERDSGSRPKSPSLEPVCDILDVIPGVSFVFKVACLVGNQFVGGEPTWAPTSGGEGQPIPQEQVCGSVSPAGSGIEIPASPSNISLAIVSDGWGIGVSWTDNSDNEAGFDIFNGVTHTKVTANQTFLSSDWGLSYDANGLSSGQTMCFRVSAYNAAGSSAPTPDGCITVP